MISKSNNPSFSTRLRLWLPLAALAVLAMHALPRADGFSCNIGKIAHADIGDGVTLRTCLWEQQPGVVVRAGPMELSKNGVLILQARTNLEGKLHGAYSSWSDDGELLVRGHYVDGLKQGAWHFADANGERLEFHYLAGKPDRL